MEQPKHNPDRIVCMVQRLGASVRGGKMSAIFKRMNLLADRPNTEVVLLNLQHGVNQKVVFGQLREQGVFDARIKHVSLFEFCAAERAIDASAPALPGWDRTTENRGEKTRKLYYNGDTLVMRDVVEKVAAGSATVRHILTDPDVDLRLKYLDNRLIESVARFGDGITDKVAYAADMPVCQTRLEHSGFQYAEHALLQGRFEAENDLNNKLVSRHFPPDCIVFVDGTTMTDLARHIPASKVLFLHADHRLPNGEVIPRSSSQIEQFDGEAIVTATKAHKAQVECDLRHRAPIRAISHYIDTPERDDTKRRHICTVSRLELDGKPVHQCIEAFTRIMHKVPDINYLIYGTGLGEARLRQMIKHKGCEDRVFIMGYTDDPTHVFKSSLLSIAPTMTEGFGLALLESLASGCPVISYDVDYGPRELIEPGSNGELVRPGDIEAIAEMILKVLNRRADYQQGCKETAARYTFDAYKARYFRLIDDLVGRPYWFDISAPDLRAEVANALNHAPLGGHWQLLDLSIRLASEANDIAGMYDGYLQKHDLRPDLQRPLMRCIWLSQRLGRIEDCRAHLADFGRRFPVNHAQFLQRYPEFLALEVDEVG